MAGTPGAALAHPLILAVGVAGLAFGFSRLLADGRTDTALAIVVGLGVFVAAFVRTEIGLWMVLFSMLLSPELTVGGGGTLAEKREVVLRSEDMLLLVIAASWCAKTAVHKELGLVLRTPLNRPIALYVGTHLFSTLLGYLTGTVRTSAGFFYVLKYVEYIVVFFIVVNNLRDRDQMWRLVKIALVTALVVSLIGAAQIPSGQRVSAPFEGDSGEPNTFGGYLLLMMAIALGIALESPHLATRLTCFALAGLMSAPFLFTLSRSSYLGFVPMLLMLAVFTTRRRLAMLGIALSLALLPVLIAATPPAVTNRVLETFQPQTAQPRVRIGKFAFDPSTSERLLAYEDAAASWARRPIFGYGVTGGFFLDAQYPRTLMETGLVGLAAFAWLIRALWRAARSALGEASDGDDRGLALGFLAGFAGLLVHAVGSNTFIIIRIMEPFWFFAGLVVMLPRLRHAPPIPPSRPVPGAGARR
jgi:hypothetical protein